jgi:hypothetical protein
MYDQELDDFKARVDLRVYAAAQGYQLDSRESWGGSAVMRHPNGDKVIIKRAASDSHYIYFSVRRDDDNGSIIDFVQNRQNISIGAVRKELRPWLGAPPVPVPSFSTLRESTKDRIAVELAYATTTEAHRHPYLETERALPPALLASDRIAGRVRADRRGNAIFPHFDAEGLCGFEIKNKGFTGFSPGGTKGLWLSHQQPDDDRLVLCESAIDALSYAALDAADRTRYASIGGSPSAFQQELIRATVARMRAGSEIVSAMDADAQGAKLAGIVRQAVELSGRDDLYFSIEEPCEFKDWNDQLRASLQKSKPPLPFRPEEPSVA